MHSLPIASTIAVETMRRQLGSDVTKPVHSRSVALPRRATATLLRRLADRLEPVPAR